MWNFGNFVKQSNVKKNFKKEEEGIKNPSVQKVFSSFNLEFVYLTPLKMEEPRWK